MRVVKIILLVLGFIGYALPGECQGRKTDGNIIGHVKSGGEHLPFVTVIIKGTNIGTTTDETGHFMLTNLPSGKHILRAQIIGYIPCEKEVMIHERQTKEVNFSLEEDALGLEEVVVTGSRSERNRKESVIPVNTITPRIFAVTQSVTVSDGLNFCPGIRVENDCQNCGFNQVRMNGMEGSYAQILIDGHPVFSGLASVYGLELIPTSMIERIEVVKGGGSVLYGSNAIAGTINLVLKEPVKNAYAFGWSAGSIGVGMDDAGAKAPDFTITMNGSVLSNDQQSGMSFFGFYHARKPFDANNDGFSEVAKLLNLTAGTRLFHRIGTRSKLSCDLFIIHEKRRGGNKFELPPHETDITEGVTHTILNGALTSRTYFRETDQFLIYASGQYVQRDSYYGANQSLSDYGATVDFTWVAGTQYLAKLGNGILIAGMEDQGSRLEDTKLGYPDYQHAVIVNDSILAVPHVENTLIADQLVHTIGLFTQYEQQWKMLKGSIGLRYDNYTITDYSGESTLQNRGVWIPRINLLVDVTRGLQARVSYARGYRAPQIFDEDLHIEASGSRRVIHVNAPGLKQETSHSAMGSLAFSKRWLTTLLDLQVEGFYTLLTDPFTVEYSEPDSAGRVIYSRTNSTNAAYVYGVNLEVNMVPCKKITLSSGFTFQQSQFKVAQEFNETRFLRTPSSYGYLTFDWEPFRFASISSTLNYTGPMLVPYFGLDQQNPETGELRKSTDFFDWGIKLSYSIPLNGTSLQLYVGMKNILNSYQQDFDSGVDRDPGYIYGPMMPRMAYAGIVFGNMF